MKIWIAISVLASIAPLGRAATQLESGQRVALVFEEGALTREWTVRTSSACSLYVWTESDDVDVMQEVRRIDTETSTERPCLAGAAPAFFAESAEADSEWSIQLRSAGPGTVEFLYVEVPETVQGSAANELARTALGELKSLLARGERSRAHDRYRAAVEEFLDRTAEQLTLEQTNVLWEFATESRTFRDYEQALACFSRLVGSYEVLYPPRAITTARARWRLALTHRSLRNLAKECDQLIQLISVLEVHEPREHAIRRDARCELSVALARLGESDWAEEEITSYLADYAQELPADHNGIVNVRTALANIRLERRDLPGARLIYREVMIALLSSRPPLDANVLRMRGNLANAYAQFGEDQKALEENRSLLESLEILSAIEDPAQLKMLGADPDFLLQFSLHVRLNLAITLQALNRNAEAIELFEIVDRERRRSLPEGDPARASARRQLADAYSQFGDHEAGLLLAQRELVELQQQYPPGHPRLLACQFTVARCLMGLGRIEELVLQAGACASGARASLRATLGLSARECLAVAAAVGREIQMLLVLTSALESQDLERSTLELIELVRVTTGTSPRSVGAAEQGSDAVLSLGEELRVSRKQLGELIATLSDGEGSDDGQGLSNALEACGRIERQYLEALIDAGLWYLDVASAEEIAAALPEGACAVSFWRSGDWDLDLRGPGESGNPGAFHAQVLRADGSISTVRLGGADVILRATREWRKAIGRPFAGAESNVAALDEKLAGELLREWVLDPVLALIGDCTRLYVCLDDELHLIPLDALPLGERHVGDQFQIRPLSFLSVLARDEPAPPVGQGMLLVGAVDYGAPEPSAVVEANSSGQRQRAAGAGLFETSFKALPRTGDEAREIAANYQRVFGASARVLLGNEATKDAVVRLAPRVRYLHLATHGGASLGPDVRRGKDGDEQRETIEAMAPLGLCGVVLANANSASRAQGILTGEELSGLDLSACELATMSACDTSAGLHRAGQGLGSLQSALRAAGARATLTSLWEVDDGWTRELMREFYGQLWGAGSPSPAQALWEAKKQLRRRHAPLRDWAGWVLTGDCSRGN